MIIRPIAEKDYSAFDALMRELHRLHSEARPDIYLPAEHIYSEEQFLEMLSEENRFMFAAESDNEVVGICVFRIRETGNENPILAKFKTALIEDIFVAEKFRRKGIAKLLFEEAEKTAKEQGASRLELMVWDFNREAMDFYAAEGMTAQRHFLEKML